MRCNGLPNARDPADLRKYINMWQLENEQFRMNRKNWLLYTDERTILTQNKLTENKTRDFLRSKEPNLGIIYAKRAEEIIGVS